MWGCLLLSISVFQYAPNLLPKDTTNMFFEIIYQIYRNRNRRSSGTAEEINIIPYFLFSFFFTFYTLFLIIKFINFMINLFFHKLCPINKKYKAWKHLKVKFLFNSSKIFTLSTKCDLSKAFSIYPNTSIKISIITTNLISAFITKIPFKTITKRHPIQS